MKNKKLLKWILPLCIVLAVAGIWIAKNMAPAEETEQPDNPDFVLEAETLDLEQLKSYELPIIIDFGADWCSPCRQFAPILESIHGQAIGSAIIKYVDVDNSSDLAGQFPVQVIPTQVFFAADGSPYVPSDSIATEFISYTDKTTGEPLFTVHEGALTEDALNAILADMGVSK